MKKLRKPREYKHAHLLNTTISYIYAHDWNLKEMKRLHAWLGRVIKFMEQG
jgi:hypothetical protein